MSTTGLRFRRRQFLQTLTAVGASVAPLSEGFGQFHLADTGTVRDGLWMFGSPVNSDYEYVHQRSVMCSRGQFLFRGAEYHHGPILPILPGTTD